MPVGVVGVVPSAVPVGLVEGLGSVMFGVGHWVVEEIAGDGERTCYAHGLGFCDWLCWCLVSGEEPEGGVTVQFGMLP